MIHRGLHSDRCATDPREKAFAELWEKENIPVRGTDYGHGILQNLMYREPEGGWRGRVPHTEVAITPLKAMVTATAIQWLGSNAGMDFLRQALNKCGYDLVKRREKEGIDAEV